MANEAASKHLQGSGLKIYTGIDLGHLETRIQEAIARRAYDHFEGRGRQHGSDLMDWFQSEEEIQRPSDVQISEEDGRVEVRVQVPGFSANEIEVGVSPNRVVIWGLKADSGNSSRSGGSSGAGRFGAILGDVPMPSPVNPARSAASFKNGWIEVHLSKET